MDHGPSHPLNPLSTFREWYLPVHPPPHKGLHPNPLPATELASYVPSIDPSSHQPILHPPRTGESISQVHLRAKEVLTRLIEQIDTHRPNVKNILLVTHAATNICLGRALTGKPDLVVGTGCATLGKYVRRREGSSWDIVMNGDGSFLARGVEVGPIIDVKDQ
jgi:transcription factor C subunit 7